MATKPKNRKKAYVPKKHSNNLKTTGLFKRRDDVQEALYRLEQMTPEQRVVLMKALEHNYGSVYFRINIMHGTFEKVGDDIDLYMLMKIFWDIKITIYSLPLGVAEDAMTTDDTDHYILEYKHRHANTLSSIREIAPMIISNFLDTGTEPFIIRAEFFPVLPTAENATLDSGEIFECGDVTEILYEYDPLIPDNAEFKHRPRTCDRLNGWSEKKLEENRNAILRKLLPH